MEQIKTAGILKSIALAVVIVVQSCNSNEDANNHSTINSNRKSDSVSLRKELIAIYNWYAKNEGVNHNSLFTKSYGIDTVKLDSVVKEMEKTDFFSKEFLISYKQIGQRTNQMLLHDSTLKEVGIAFPFQDFDNWYGGQGWEPDWNSLTIHDLSIVADSASLKWTCDKPIATEPLAARFKKQNNKWRLSYLELLDLKMYP